MYERRHSGCSTLSEDATGGQRCAVGWVIQTEQHIVGGAALREGIMLKGTIEEASHCQGGSTERIYTVLH